MEYLTTGLVNIDHITPYDREQEPFSKLGGGAMYALSALKIWTESAFVVVFAGRDFEDYFGDWMRNNNCSFEGINCVLDETTRAYLAYQENGTYIPILSSKWFSGARMMPNMQLIAPYLNASLKGVHVLSHGEAAFFEQLDRYRKQYGFKVGFEIGSPFDSPNVPELIKEVTDRYIDYFSLSLVEAREYFPDIRDEKDALEMCSSLRCPVYFRMGKNGAYYIENGKSSYFPMVDLFSTVDPTGCGNVSTAAAFWAFCEGKSPKEIGAIAAVSASLNAAYDGLIPKVEPWMREKCIEYVKEA